MRRWWNDIMANIVITGSSKGIGFGLSREFSNRGHNVMLAGSSQDSVDAALGRMSQQQSDGRVEGRVCEITDAAQVQALWDAAVRAYNSVDIWINNAGLARTTWPIKDTPDDQIAQMICSNLLGTTLGSKVAVNGMLNQGQGKIFNMLGGGSDGEFFPGMGVYGSTKRGMDYMTNALVKENKDSNLIIAKVRPGMIITEGVLREIAADRENFEKSRKTMNVLCDTIETVAPFLVDEMLKCEKSGSKIAWLNGGKIGKRMMLSRFRPAPDKFKQFGL
jgi:NAD(P)-dependent dehydrogenase (short-subunit alcohol dehydrogenase family)